MHMLTRLLRAGWRGTLVLLGATWITVVSGVALGAGPPFPDPAAGQGVYDEAGVLTAAAEDAADATIDALQARSGVALVVYIQVQRGADAARADADARALLDQWQVGGDGGEGIAIVIDLRRNRQRGTVGVAGTEAYHRARLDHGELDALVRESMAAAVQGEDVQRALTQGLLAVSLATSGATPISSPLPTAGASSAPEPTGPPQRTDVPAGPPFPEPVDGTAVYDAAGVFRPETVADAERIIDAIEERTRAEIVVYTQVKPEADTPAEAEQDAIALIDQWGVGRRGFDDGMVILFDLDESLRQGQVQLYAAPGFRATYLPNEERQRIFEEEMLPFLRSGDLDGALRAALERVDESATPEHAATLQQTRQIDAVLGFVGAPVAALLLGGGALLAFFRFGRDPRVLDDPSVLMAGPPRDMTPAAAALVLDGVSTRRTLTTAMLDLASRGELAFRHDGGRADRKKIGVELFDGSSSADPQVIQARRRPLSTAEPYALARLRAIAQKHGAPNIEPHELLDLGSSVSEFDRRLERYAMSLGWFREAPGTAIGRWAVRGVVELLAGVVVLVAGLAIPSGGLTILGGAVIAAAIVTLILARRMPSRTREGATMQAMLSAYRRTLHKTLEQARSMDQVLHVPELTWLHTPDRAVVWGVALGLHADVQRVLERTMEDSRSGTAAPGYVPHWYASGSSSEPSGGPVQGVAPGLMASSVVPDLGGMMTALGTIGNSASGSGSSSSGGGFSGGSSGGGGGGAGGGF